MQKEMIERVTRVERRVMKAMTFGRTYVELATLTHRYLCERFGSMMKERVVGRAA